MKIRTTDQLFPHKCQIKDMKLSGFSPNSIRYHCNQCGGVLILRLDRNEWESVFGDRKNLNLSKSILMQLDAIEDEEEIQETNKELGDKDKFVWSPPED